MAVSLHRRHSCSCLSAIVFTVESGIFDEPLAGKRRLALNSAIGPRYRAEVGSTVIRFTSEHAACARGARRQYD